MAILSVCDTKIFYDTEWEATLAAGRTEDKFGEEMEPYQCGSHWHITHKNPDHRKGVGGSKFTKCRNCGEVMKRFMLDKHKCEESDE